jgi:hypothetical protein
VERLLKAIRAEREETRFTESWIKGKKMSFAEAISLALKIVEEK